MASQGYHLSINKGLINKIDSSLFLDKRFIAGTLVPDTLVTITTNRRFSHYTDGSYMSYPTFEELKDDNLNKLNPIDTKVPKKYICDPPINLESFFEHNTHLSDADPYKIGIYMHLFADFYYDKLIKSLFDTTYQDQGYLIYQGKKLKEEEFRSCIYSAYPWLDQYVYQKENINNQEIEIIRNILINNFSDKALEFILRFIYNRKSISEPKNNFLNQDLIDDLFQSIDSSFQDSKVLRK